MARKAQDTRLTSKQVAILAGITTQRLAQLPDGDLVPETKGRAGVRALYDIETVRDWLEERHRVGAFGASGARMKIPTVSGEAAPPAATLPSKISEEEFVLAKRQEQVGKGRKAVTEAELLELKLRVQQETFGPIEVMTSALSIVGKKLRNVMEGLPNRIKAKHEHIPAEVINMVTDEVAEAMTDLSQLDDDWVELATRASQEDET